MFDKGTKVLIVDDTKTIQKLMKSILTELGFTEVNTASTGEEGWSMIESPATPYGLVISDLNMPGMTGIDLLRKVRGNDSTKELPFIILTIENDIIAVNEAIKSGVNGYALKPFTKSSINEALGNAYNAIHR